MRWRIILAAGVVALGMSTAASIGRAQDYYNGYGYGYNANTYTYAPPPYGGYGYHPPAPYAPGYVAQPYPYYGNYYYGASPAYGYAYGGPIVYGRFGHRGRVGFRFGWW